MKRFFTIILMTVIFTLAGQSVFAAAPAPSETARRVQGQVCDGHQSRQQALKDMAEKFDALPQADKAKFYKLDAKMSDLVGQMASLYARYDLIDDDVAEKITKMAKDRSRTARQQGNLPGLVGPY